MSWKRSRWTLVEWSLAWTLMAGLITGLRIAAQTATTPAAIATTTVTDTVYRADGTAAQGTVLISWGAFATGMGANVPAGSTAVTIGTSGVLSVPLVPNAGSNPVGSYYTVVYHLDDGSVTREYWVVPVSAGPVTVGAIRSTVLPASVALQTVSKNYVDVAIAAAVTGHPLSSTPYVVKTGDTMAGPLVLPGDPIAPLQASDKHYVDAQVAGLAGGAGQKVSLVPSATQTVAQPGGTQLQVNNLNGKEYASQYVTGTGDNGIAGAAASAGCTSGCDVVAEQTYGPNELAAPATWASRTHVEDLRGGARSDSFLNPSNAGMPGDNAAVGIHVVSTESTQAVHAATGAQEIFSTGLEVTSTALTGGSNIYPKGLQSVVPYFKTTYTALRLTGVNNTLGQHVLTGYNQNCYGVGDCLIGGMFMNASGGFRDDADEGAHPFDLSFSEDSRVFTGTCAGGCTTGATTLTIAPSANNGTQGDGRYLINTTPSKVLTTGSLIGGGTDGRQPVANFSGTGFAVSTLLETAQNIPTQANTTAPGTITIAIVTSGTPAGFATSTGSLPATAGVACIADISNADGRPMNFETATYSVVDSSHIQMNLIRPHGTGATIAVGGLCGYGLEQTVDTTQGIRQVFPVIASTSPTTLLYAGGQTAIVGLQGLPSAYANFNLPIASIRRAGNVVTLTTTGNLPVDVSGLTMQVQGVTDATYNGTFAVTTTGSNTLTYVATGADSTSGGGGISFLTGGFVLYPMAEALSVYNPASKAVDGQMTLATNTVNWAAGDTVEQPHYFQEAVGADLEFIQQFAPRPSRNQSAGILYAGVNGPGLHGWQIVNQTPVSAYFGNGGTHTAPPVGMEVIGAWQHSMELEAGEDAAIKVHCNSHGCDRWNSGYDLFQMDTSVGVDRMHYTPANSTLTFNLRGTNYQFTPLGLTAGTVNANVLNGTTLNVTTVNASAVHGTVDATSVPVFVGSGPGHQTGAVPDPGAIAGTTRFLREDGAWVATGGGSGPVPTPMNVPKRSSLLGEYLLNEGSGTVAHDTSGNGYDGTLAGANGGPVWEGSADLNFTGGQAQYVSVPAALNAAKTWQIAMYVPVYGNGTGPQAPGYGTNSNFAQNPAVLCGSDTAHPCFYQGDVGQLKTTSLFRATTDTTQAAEPMDAGWHVFTVICGTSGASQATKTHYLYDGAEVGGYFYQGDANTCPTLPTSAGSGNYQIGGSTLYGGAFWTGKIAAAWAWSVPLSVSDGAAAAKAARDYLAAKGVPSTYRAAVTTTPLLLAGLDSRTFGVGLTSSTVWPATMVLTDTSYTRVNLGIPGAAAYEMCQQFDLVYGQQITANSGPVITVLWGGINDILRGQGSWTARQYANSLRCMVRKAKAAGSRVILATEIAAGAAGSASSTAYQALDPIIRAEAFGWGVDNIADLATDAHFGTAAASQSTTCFGDTVHPTAACEPYITTIMQDAVNELLGSSETNHNLSAAATYQEVAGDRFLDLTGTAAQTVTLPACVGYSLPRYMTNLGAAASTVAPFTGDTLTGSTALPIGALAKFLPIPGPLTTAGCKWQRVQ